MEQNEQPRRKASFAASMKAVFWSFFGVRKRRDYEDDAVNLNPVHVIVAALLGVAIFIGVLLLLVKLAVAQ
ncbi:DUF2970 domain-containing protein [Massilia litorea]|uniref:DUF2970 domain-containing protein n=1 Tax=Massilia litorea TaxID=2769491 RepID=A0A7L9U4L7_9BURK|nr:DUF2970 domain-containing protein [Massilia litorea]QOL50011.1 DUF2970 domain-containing protein [Massilia litorea]